VLGKARGMRAHATRTGLGRTRKEEVVGFHGEIVIGRSEKLLGRAAPFGGAGAVPAAEVRPGGWQTLRLGRGTLPKDPARVLRDVVFHTRAPACVVSVYEGGYALARGLGPAGCWWEAWLKPEVAAAKLVEVPDDVDDMGVWRRTPAFTAAVAGKRAALDADVPIDALGALAWASSAGFGHDVPPGRVEAVLRSRSAAAEDLIPVLLDALGFPAPVPAAVPVLTGGAAVAG
jgi:hypothetical protein